jgi:hypothetical protein
MAEHLDDRERAPEGSLLTFFSLTFALTWASWLAFAAAAGRFGTGVPRLEARLGLARASVLLGVIWACWHLPFFFIP